MTIQSREHALLLDTGDPLKDLRLEFIIPTKQDLKAPSLHVDSSTSSAEENEPCIYFCGNSLGLQPRRTAGLISQHLLAWAKKGVLGHFTEHEDSRLPGFLHIDEAAAKLIAPIVGASVDEVAIMETLTANLHFLMASFYRPNKDRFKIILEGKAFPSDHYAVESQIIHHGFDPSVAMVMIEPENDEMANISTAHIISAIDKHATSTALILLPGVQYYTGQYMDMRTITAYAHSRGILIGWDLAHAVGNVELFLHDWQIDFAAWCNYKYLNSGPGAIAGLFVHSTHGKTDGVNTNTGQASFRPRLSGWWGGNKAIRFEMGNRFIPIPGAPGYQVGNPSALAITAVLASLEVFSLTSMSALRQKSLALSGYLETLLTQPSEWSDRSDHIPYQIISPSDPSQRGAQISVRLDPGLLEPVLKYLEQHSVIVDERKPDVIRIAPVPLYNTFDEVWQFVQIFVAACVHADTRRRSDVQTPTVMQGKKDRGWAAIL